MSDFVEAEHPRDKYGKFTTKQLKELCKIDYGKFVKTGQTTEVIPELKKGEYCGKDNYPRTSNIYTWVVNDGKRIVEQIKSYRNGQETSKILTVAKVGDRERKRIEELTKEPLSAKVHTIHIDEIVHTENRHGTNGKTDNSMSSLDAYENIPSVLHDFDNIDYVYDKNGKIATSKRYKDKHGKQAPLIKYTKKINNKICYVVEAVTDCKRGDISIITAYRQ